jgi:hypothetical protein
MIVKRISEPKKLKPIFLLSLLCIVLVTGCGKKSKSVTGAERKPVQITIVWPDSAFSCVIDVRKIESDTDKTITHKQLYKRFMQTEQVYPPETITVNRPGGVTEQVYVTTSNFPQAEYNLLLSYYTGINATGAIVTQTSSSLTVDDSGQATTSAMTSFWFYYSFDLKGNRYWSQISSNNWVERYPDNSTTQFIFISRRSVENIPGIVVRRINRESDATLLEVFIPDRETESRWLRFRTTESEDWSWLAELTYY